MREQDLTPQYKNPNAKAFEHLSTEGYYSPSIPPQAVAALLKLFSSSEQLQSVRILLEG